MNATTVNLRGPNAQTPPARQVRRASLGPTTSGHWEPAPALPPTGWDRDWFLWSMDNPTPGEDRRGWLARLASRLFTR